MEIDDFTVIVPFCGHDDPFRESALDFVLRWLQPHGWPVVVGYGDPNEPWSKGAVVDRAVSTVDTPGLVIHDADVIVEPDALSSCASAVVSGWPWAQPHSEVYRLARRTTQLVIAGAVAGPHHALGGAALERRPHYAPPGGGIVVLSRAAYDTVGGIDPRFVGWGGEDISFARALDTLTGPAFRLRVAMWHLFHPPQIILPGRRGSPETEALASKYLDAAGDPVAMAEVVGEMAVRTLPS